MAQSPIQLQGLISPREYLDELFSASNTIIIWLSSKCVKCNVCHTIYGLKVYQRLDSLSYRIVRLVEEDKLESGFSYYSERMKKTRKSAQKYKFAGPAGADAHTVTLKFKCSDQGRVSVTWNRDGYLPKNLHVCYRRMRTLLESVE